MTHVNSHRAKNVRRLSGFTLIELMIVVAVVAILTAIAYPSYQDAVRKGHRGQAKADLVELAQRAERFRTINNGSYSGFWAQVPDTDKVSPRTGTARYILARQGADTGAVSFVIEAVPQDGQANDTRCMTLTIDQLGRKGVEGGATAAATDCW